MLHAKAMSEVYDAMNDSPLSHLMLVIKSTWYKAEISVVKKGLQHSWSQDPPIQVKPLRHLWKNV